VKWAKDAAKKRAWIPQEIATFADLAPTIVLTICNGAINPITKELTEKEQYDFRADLITAQITRMWLGKTLNFLIFLTVETQRAFDVTIFIPDTNGGFDK